eukprot:CAMPEP_0118951962 /NCGR_PEP_ID=MMETSP1169-20130426/53981_1 /TAXON_ID=36882 /ORGANISM="Pyramimonas obovata, Strain CCMP722" /LENGTH=433 /DNA_ID=CAMNT_0006899111 /DNA_START=303 /DNA_END=1604 /DNA_ORIENTATION=+
MAQDECEDLRGQAVQEKRRRAEQPTPKLTGERSFGASHEDMSVVNVGKRIKVTARKTSLPGSFAVEDGDEEGGFARREASLNERETALDAREVDLSRKLSQLDKEEQALREAKLKHDRLMSTLSERQAAIDEREDEIVTRQLSLDAREQVLDEKAQALAAKERGLGENAPEQENPGAADEPKNEADARSGDAAEPEMSATVTAGDSDKTVSQQSVDREKQLNAKDDGSDTEDEETCTSTRQPLRLSTTGDEPHQEQKAVRKRGKRVVLSSVGQLVDHKGWCSKAYVFTDGYKASTTYRSSVDLTNSTTHDCSIFSGGKFHPEPTFRVVARDRPDEPLDGKSASACWKAVLVRLCTNIERRRAAGENVSPPPRTAISGPDYFGFTDPKVITALEAMDPHRTQELYWQGKRLEQLARERVQARVEEEMATAGAFD